MQPWGATGPRHRRFSDRFTIRFVPLFVLIPFLSFR